MVNSEEFTDNAEYLTLYTWCHINRCRYNRVRLRYKPKITYLVHSYVLWRSEETVKSVCWFAHSRSELTKWLFRQSRVSRES